MEKRPNSGLSALPFPELPWGRSSFPFRIEHPFCFLHVNAEGPRKRPKIFSKRQRTPYFLRKIPAWWGRGAGKPTVRVVFRRKRPFLWKSGTAPTTGGRGRFSPNFSYTNIIGGILSKKGSKKAPIPGAFHCEETAGRFPHSANRKRLALAELQGLGAGPAKYLGISSLSAWFLA